MGLFRRTLNAIFLPLEQVLLRRYSESPGFPPIYIVGPPRSGSTVLTQMMTQYFHVGYFSNFTHLFYKTPLSGLLLERTLMPTDSGKLKLQSDYGRIRGWGSPSEAADYWYHWFPDREDVHGCALSIPDEDLSALCRQTRAISSMIECPLLHKNLYNSTRIAALRKADPGSLFIFVKRDPLNTAISIYHGYRRFAPQKGTWWSVPPKNVQELLDLGLAEKAAAQTFYLYQQIQSDLERFAPESYHSIDYELLCENPQQHLHQIETWFVEHGVEIRSKGLTLSRLTPSSGQAVEATVRESIDAKLNELHAISGA